MKHLFFFILSKILLSQNFAYEKFQEYVKSPTGCVFQIKLKQSYNNENFVSNGTNFFDIRLICFFLRFNDLFF